MTDSDAFIRTICLRTAQGLDTTAERLVFAAWLEEHAGSVACKRCAYDPEVMLQLSDCPNCHGTGFVPNGYAERAEFIRVQCELAKGNQYEPLALAMGTQLVLCVRRNHELQVLRRRERELLGGYGHLWLPTIDSPDNTWRLGSEFSRGFVASIRCSFREWRGEACSRCDGAGKALGADRPFGTPEGRNWSGPCPTCSGIGRINALGPAIVAVAPIEEFEATDEWPTEIRLPWDGEQYSAHGPTVQRSGNNRRALEWAREKSGLLNRQEASHD